MKEFCSDAEQLQTLHNYVWNLAASTGEGDSPNATFKWAGQVALPPVPAASRGGE